MKDEKPRRGPTRRSPGIPVDFLPPESHGLPGRLGLTGAPGRWRPGLDASSDRLVEDDLRWLRDELGTRLLVTLLEEFEMTRLGISRLLPAVRRARVRSAWLPIADMTAPSDPGAVSRVVHAILDAMAAGETVVVHCRGGIGRSGTIAACCLVACGRGAAQAIALVRRARPGALEVPAQEEFVARFAEVLRDDASARGPGRRSPRPRRP